MISTVLRVSVLCLLLTVVPSLSRAGTIAQYDIWDNYSGSWGLRTFHDGIQVGQTFNPTVSGTVTSIDTTIVKMNSTSLPVVFYITPTLPDINGLQPDFSNVLSTGTLSASDPQLSNIAMPFWTNTPMSSALLEAGTTYMLVATAPGTPDNTYGWGHTSVNGYSGGSASVGYTGDVFVEQLWDLPFRVNAADQVASPEPATWAALGLGLLALGALKRRRS